MSLVSFRTSRGPLFPKPVFWSEHFFSYHLRHDIYQEEDSVKALQSFATYGPQDTPPKRDTKRAEWASPGFYFNLMYECYVV